MNNNIYNITPNNNNNNNNNNSKKNKNNFYSVDHSAEVKIFPKPRRASLIWKLALDLSVLAACT